jgi:uncharacterized protein
MLPMLHFLYFVLALYLLSAALGFVFQRAITFHPTPPAPSLIGETVSFPVPGATLSLIVVRRPGAAAAIYFGGNAESVAGSAPELAQAVPERSWVFVNYRGYGGSSGAPTERALVADALAVYDWLRATHADIAVVGRSLGSGVAVQLAAARPVTALVLVTPYDSLVSVGQQLLKWLPVSWFALDRFESTRYAPTLRCPTLVLIAQADKVIPPAHARRLVAAFTPGVVSAIEVPGAEHNDIQLWPGFYGALAAGVTAGREGR